MLAGLVVRILDLAPLRIDASAPTRYYGSAISGSDGSWTITGVPPGSDYIVDIQCALPASQVIGAPTCSVTDETWGDAAIGAFEVRPIVANQIAQVGDLELTRRMIVRPASGSTVAAGAVLFLWSSVPGATTYCVGLVDQSANDYVALPGSNCGIALPWFAVQATSLVSPPLVAGHKYSFGVFAFDRAPGSAFTATCDNGSPTSTCLGTASSEITMR